MVTIRMARAGTKKVPFYRVVVTDHRSPRDGNFLEKIGTWDPRAGEGRFTLDRNRYEFWIKNGARPSELVESLVRRFPAEAAAAPAQG
jgi:small subunit ribosomal protein S16